MRAVQHLAVLLFAALCSGQPNRDKDPCQPQGHAVLNQTFRSTGWDVRPEDVPQCDNRLRKGWYRFIGHDGQSLEMPTKCPGPDTCGTNMPFWMDGPQPSGKGDIADNRLCGVTRRTPPTVDCCEVEDQVFVQQCDDFFVYFLTPTFDCASGYCAGAAQRCPVGKWSVTNIEPCRDPAPVLATLPLVKGPIVSPNQSFEFHCEITYGPNDPDQIFDVLWTFDGKTDPSIKPQTLTGGQKVATLSGDKLKGHLDTNVGCQVSSYYLGREKDKKTYQSATNLFGVQAVNLTGPNVRNNKSFDFECEVTFGSTDPDQQIEVIWTFNGNQDPQIKPQIITGKDRKLTLDGAALKDHLNTNVGCQARLIYGTLDIKTAFRQSNTYFAGIRVSTTDLQIKDSEGEKTITVTSTIPVVCDQGEGCCLRFNATINNNAVVSLKDSCGYTICSSDWDDEKKQASVTITVVPSRNAISTGRREAVLTFGGFVLSGTGLYLDIFKTYRPNPVKIVVILEAGFMCPITGDPHMEGFDYKKNYDLYDTGDFTAYVVKDRNFMVQIRTWPCWAVTCVCGVVVREKNNIVRVDGCDKPDRVILATVDIPYKLSPGAVVQQSANGLHVGILLPSGSEVKINMGYIHMNVYISTPAYDRGKAFGICGTNDGNPANDFTHPDGTVTPPCTGPGRCIPVPFTESWRVKDQASMFVTAPGLVEEKPPTQYCSCKVDFQGKSQKSCSPRQHIQETNIACPNCRVITETLQPAPWGQPDQEQTDYVHTPVKAVDPNKQWPNDQGVTEAQAREMCDKAIQKSQIFSQCKEFANRAVIAMSDCLSDILLGGTTEALDAITSSFTSNCQAEMATQEKNYINIKGNLFLNPDITVNVCPTECTQHGTCGPAGKCECSTGWTGETCQINQEGPQIKDIGGAACYASDQTCDNVTFGISYEDIFSKLTCRVQPIDNQGSQCATVVFLPAIRGLPGQVTCYLPRTELSSQKFLISISADGISYGNALPVHAFDHTCLDCVSVTECKQKNSACHISNVCYRQGQVNTKNQQEVCDTSKSLTAWSRRP